MKDKNKIFIIIIIIIIIIKECVFQGTIGWQL